MKNFATFLFTLVISVNSFATVHTVSNNTFSPGQFTNLQTAIDSANAGDSIYVQPGPNDYGSINIYKLLYLFGGGGNPYTYELNDSSVVDNVTFEGGSSGSFFQGFNVANGSNVTVNSGLSNITIARSSLSYNLILHALDTNIVVANNFFNRYNGQSILIYSNNPGDVTALIANNFFNCGQLVFLNNQQESGITVQNNIFYGSPSGGISSTASNSNEFFSGNIGITARNNIFYCVGGSNGTFASGCANCVFLNNITYSPSASSQALPDANNSGSNNISNTDPQFINAPAAYTNIAYNNDTLFKFNWALAAGSPGHNAGTDNTDIGIYGGLYPMPNFEGVTKLPQVRLLNINNAGVAPNGTLNVNVIATKRN